MDKQKLTPKTAEIFALQKFLEIKDAEAREFQVEHTKAVVQCAMILTEGRNINKESLEIGCWLHDIGYIVSRENHAEHALNIIAEDGFEIDDIIKDCILNHGNSGSPQTEEGKIIRVADKLSIINPEMIKILLRYSLSKNSNDKEKDFEFIKKMANQGVDLLKLL